MKYWLGILIDSALTLIPHIERVTSLALRSLGFIVRNTKLFTNVECIKRLFYTLVRSRLEYGCVIWSPYHQCHIYTLERVLRKFIKYLYFKMFGVYPVTHCDQQDLLQQTNEHSLESRRNLASLIFIQRLLHGSLGSTNLLSQINIVIPRMAGRYPHTFQFIIPNTYHHFNSPLYRCFRLYNNLCNQNIDIFFDSFKSKSMKNKLLLLQ